ncbi:AEC family transporter [Colwellia sp. KU-HH00111]|uniref:AEC family transporter n=1 Tax=Colwellia sp. KU-HH00111 TaxID=3127652 RepID=UPI00310C75B8
MFSQIFTIIFPLFAIVSIGFFYGRKHAPDMVSANQLNLDIFVPALILHVLADKSFQVDTYSQLAIGGAFVVIFSGFLAWPVAKLMGFNVKTFVPPMMFSNSGNIGLPLALFAFGEQALPAAVMLFIVENTLHFSLGMKMMDRKISLFSIVKIPMVFAVVVGLCLSVSGLVLPEVVTISIEMLGMVSIPLMLFSLGVRLTSVNLQDWKIGLVGAIICPVTGIILVLLVAPFLHLTELQYGQLLIFGILPPAVLNFMVAEKYNQQPKQVASIVLIGNLASLATIPTVLYFLL